MRYLYGAVVGSGLLAVTAVFLFASSYMDIVSFGDEKAASDSVELGLLELSPLGEAGGYAMPASGCSYVHAGRCLRSEQQNVRVCYDAGGRGNGQICQTVRRNVCVQREQTVHGCTINVNLQAQKYSSGSWSGYSGANRNMVNGNSIRLKWNTGYTKTAVNPGPNGWNPGQVSCGGTNFSAGGDRTGNNVNVTEPSAGDSTLYRITCTYYNLSATDALRITNVRNPVNGSCGPAAKNYPYNASGFSGATCSAGTASGASFPARGGSDSWTCVGSNGGSNKSCSASRDYQPPAVDLRVREGGSGTYTNNTASNPLVVLAPGDVRLWWTSSNTTSCGGTNFATGGSKTGSNKQVTEPLVNNSKTYKVTCTGLDGSSVTDSVTVKVVPNECADGLPQGSDGLDDFPADPGCSGPYDNDESDPPPSVNLSANPTTVDYGDSTGLSWNTTNAVTCQASNAWSGIKNVSGNNVSSGPITRLQDSVTFGLTCRNADGEADFDDAVVNINPPGSDPTGDFCDSVEALNISRSIIRKNDPVTLTWSIGEGSTCTLIGPGIEASGVTRTGCNQSVLIEHVQNSGTYNLTCGGIVIPDPQPLRVLPTIQET